MRNKKKGYVVIDPYGCCVPDEVPVYYDDETAFEGTDWTLLMKSVSDDRWN